MDVDVKKRIRFNLISFLVVLSFWLIMFVWFYFWLQKQGFSLFDLEGDARMVLIIPYVVTGLFYLIFILAITIYRFVQYLKEKHESPKPYMFGEKVKMVLYLPFLIIIYYFFSIFIFLFFLYEYVCNLIDMKKQSC